MHFKIQFFAALFIASFKASSGSKLISGISTDGGLSGGVQAITGVTLVSDNASTHAKAKILFLVFFFIIFYPLMATGKHNTLD